jgi:hypothetical protein
MTTATRSTDATTRTQATDGAVGTTTSALNAASPLPQPTYANGPPTDDLQTALAVLMIRTSRDNRAVADKQQAASSKAQEEAHARKIDKMKELADDTYTQAIVDGVCQGVSAAAQAGSAGLSYSSSMDGIGSKLEDSPMRSAELAQHAASVERTSKFLDAGGKLVSAGGVIGSGALKRAQEDDRKDMAIADRDIDRAKSAVEGASSDSKRAQDDERETINYIKQYLAAKTQAAQAAIIRG